VQKVEKYTRNNYYNHSRYTRK